MRDAGPAPMLRMEATRSLNASTSRKSSASASGTAMRCQCCPPSVVRSTVPFAPLAHATCAETALTPRRRALTPLVCRCQVTSGAGLHAIRTHVETMTSWTRNLSRLHTADGARDHPVHGSDRQAALVWRRNRREADRRRFGIAAEDLLEQRREL